MSETLLKATGAPVKMVMIHEGGGFEAYSLRAARPKLRIQAGEPDSVVINTVNLLANTGDDCSTHIAEEPGYESFEDDSLISTAEWANVTGTIWNGTAEAWSTEDGSIMVAATAAVDLDRYGLTECTVAVEAILHNVPAIDVAGQDGHDLVHHSDGKVYVRVLETFQPDEFEPRIVADAVYRALSAYDVATAIRAVQVNGIIFDDNVIDQAADVDGRAVAYAALHGRTLSDAEIIAATREYAKRADLAWGFLANRDGITIPGGNGNVTLANEFQAAFTAWRRNRSEKVACAAA